MNIAEHPIWVELAEEINNNPMPTLHFKEVGPDYFHPPSDHLIVTALNDLGKGRISLQQFIYRMALAECEDEQGQ